MYTSMFTNVPEYPKVVSEEFKVTVVIRLIDDLIEALTI